MGGRDSSGMGGLSRILCPGGYRNLYTGSNSRDATPKDKVKLTERWFNS